MSQWMPSFTVDPDVGIGSKKKHKRARSEAAEKRLCANACGTVLNSYNTSDYCAACQRRLGPQEVRRGKRI